MDSIWGFMSPSSHSSPHLLKFMLQVGTQLAFIPSLLLIWERRRHFEAFVGSLQFVASIFFCTSEALGVRLLLSTLQWHQMSDILTETYGMLICIHLMGLKSEDTMHLLRYIAFAGAWIAKLADGWDNMTLEWSLLACYGSPVLVLVLQKFTGPLPCPLPFGFHKRQLPYNRNMAVEAVAASVAGFALLLIELYWADTPSRLFNSLAHLCAGAGTYYCWKILPCLDKSDDLPTFR